MINRNLIIVFLIALLFVSCSSREINQPLTLKNYTIGDTIKSDLVDGKRIVGGVQGTFWLTPSDDGILKSIIFESTTDRSAALKCIEGFKANYDYKYKKASIDLPLKTDSIFAYHSNNKLIAYTFSTFDGQLVIQLILQSVPNDYKLQSEEEAINADF